MTLRRKKLIICFASALLAVALFAMFAGTVLADHAPGHAPTPVNSKQGSGFGDLLGQAGGFITGLGAIASLEIWGALLMIIQTLASAVLFIAGFFLDNIFYYNVVLNPNNMPAVQEGWAIMRDIANSIFILIILWIAFTIIFNVEKQGTQKLLVRIILIALLINFSLTLVSVVFGVANALAVPFRDAIAGENKNDVASIIIGRVRLQTIFEPPNTAAVEKYKTDQPFAKSNCGFGSLTRKAGAGCLLGAETVDFATSFTKGFTGGADLFGSLTRAVSASISVLFLGLAILSFIIASITLLIRLVAMVFLSVLAPAAFIAAAIPTAKAQQLWNKWLSELFCWAFYAPAFYFLFWLSLRMLEVMTDGLPPASPGNFGSFILAMLPFIVFFAFLWASVKIGKYLGCEGAGMAIDWGKKLGGLGLAAATGGAAALATYGLARTIKPEGAVSRGLTRIATTPGLRWLGGAYPQRLASRFVGSEQKKVAEQSKDIKLMSKSQTIADLGATISPHRKVAALEKIAKEGWMEDAIGEHGAESVGRWMELSARYGMHKDIRRTVPHLITEANFKTLVPEVKDLPLQEQTVARAKRIVIEKIKTDELPDMSAAAMADPQVLDSLLKTVTPEHWRQVARSKNQALLQKMQSGLTPELSRDIRPETYRFLASNAAQSMGLKLPEGAAPPVELAREEAQEILTEEARVAAREIQTIESEIRRRTGTLETLERQLQGLDAQRSTAGLDERTRTQLQARMNDVNTQISELRGRITQFEEELQRRRRAV